MHLSLNALCNNSSENIILEASNSSPRDKAAADVICTDKNDERTIQAAIDSCGKCGNVLLLPGEYRLDEFIQYQDTGQPSCLRFPDAKDGAQSVNLSGTNEEIGAKLLVTAKALEGLGTGTGKIVR